MVNQAKLTKLVMENSGKADLSQFSSARVKSVFGKEKVIISGD